MTHCEIGFTALLIIICTGGIGIVMLSTLHKPKVAKVKRKKKRTHTRIE
jgi:hypothetical protein